MTRRIAPVSDVLALVHWVRTIKDVRPSVLNVGTPKAGLLGGIAGWICRVPRRIYVVRGLRLEGETGMLRRGLWLLEWLSIRLATDVIVVSHSLAEELVQLQLLSAKRSGVVIGDGSSNGVDAEEVRRQASLSAAIELRRRLGIKDDTFVIGFVGRINGAKGADVLAAALHSIATHGLDIACLCIGEAEDSSCFTGLSNSGVRLIHVAHTPYPWQYYSVMDVLCLPSRREGFPNVVLEAASASVPSVVAAATGATDAVKNGITGSVVPAEDSDALAGELLRLMRDSTDRTNLGRRAFERAKSDFSSPRIWLALEGIYKGDHGSDAKVYPARES